MATSPTPTTSPPSRRMPTTVSDPVTARTDRLFKWLLWIIGIALAAVLAYQLVVKPVIRWWHTPSATHVTTRLPGTQNTSQCPGQVVAIQLGRDWTELPQGRSCRIIHEIELGPIEFADFKGVYQAHGWQARNPIRARAPGGRGFMRMSWCPLGSGIRQLNWDCSPKG